MPKSPAARQYLPLAFSCLLLSALVYAGCGGGGGATTNNAAVTDTSPVISSIEGYAYTLSADVAAGPARPAPSAAISWATAPPGYVPLSNATVQLHNVTGAATLTNENGYFKINVTQNQLRSAGLHTLTIQPKGASSFVSFTVNIASGLYPRVQVEWNTSTGDLNVKELAADPAGSSLETFVWASGTVTSNAGALAGATVTATQSFPSPKSKSVLTDVNGFFQLTGLGDGYWTIRVSKTDYVTQEKSVYLSSTFTLTNVNFDKIPGTFVVSDILATKFSGSTVTIEWRTSVPATSQVEYGTTAAYGQVSPLSNILVQTHSVLLQNLSLNTSYHYRVRSIDGKNNSVYSGDYTFTTTDGAIQDTDAPIINTWDYTKSHNSFTIVFTMNKSAYGRIEYGTTRQNLVPTALQGPSTTITVDVVDLTPNTDYYVDLVGINIADTGIISRQAIGPIRTDAEPDLTAPVISSVSVSDLAPTSFTISWTTNEKANSQVYYDLVAGTAAKEVAEYNPLSSLQNVAPQVTFHQIQITDLAIDKTYYLRPVSRDSSGNVGKSPTEIVVRTPKPNTTLSVVTTSENPGAGALAIGEESKVLRLKITGSDTEAIDLTRITFQRTGTAVSEDYEPILLKHESSGGTVTYTGTLLAGAVVFDMSSTKVEIPKGGEVFLDLAVKLKSSALGKTLAFALQQAADLTATGKTFGLAAAPTNNFPISGATQTVQKGILVIAPGDSATTETTLSTGLSNIVFLEFKLTAQYEDIYLQTVQAEQFGTATTSEFNNVTLYYGIQPLASAPGSNTTQGFTSSTVQGLMTIPKDATRTLKIIASVPPSAKEGRVIQFRLDPAALGGLGASSGLAPATSGSLVNGSRYTLGLSEVKVASSFLAPTAQIFVAGDVSKDLFAFTVGAGGAEDMLITSIKLTQNGTAGNGDVSNFNLLVDNLTVGSASFAAGEITVSNAAGMFLVPKGGQKTVKVIGDISGGTGKTIQLSVKTNGDVQGTGTTSGTVFASTGTSSGDSHVVTGKLQAQADGASPSGNVIVGKAATNLFSFQLVSTGEDVRLRKVYVKVNGDSRLLSNLQLTDVASGSSWSDPELSSKGWAFNVNEGSTLTSGVAKTYRIQGDVTGNADFNGFSFNLSLDNGGITGIGASSNVVFNSRGGVTGNTLSLVMGSLALSLNNTVSIPMAITAGAASAQNLFAFDLTAGAGEGVTISAVTVQGVQGVASSSYGASGNVSGLTLSDGTVTANAVNSGSLFSFSFATPISLAAGATGSFTLQGSIPQSAVRGTMLQFAQAATKISCRGTTSGLSLTATGSANGPAIQLQAASVQVQPNAANPPPTDYPANTVADIEMLRFDVLAGAEEDVTLKSANFVLSSTTVLDTSTFKLVHYENGVASGTEYSGAAFTVDGSLIAVNLSGTALTVTAGSSAHSFRFLARFKSNVQVGGSAKIDMSTTTPLTATGVVSAQTVTAAGIVTGNSMRVTGTADTTAPTITHTSATDVSKTTSSARIVWTTDEYTQGTVWYRKSGGSWTASPTISPGNSSAPYQFSIDLAGLTANTAYDYYIACVDNAGNSRFEPATAPTAFLSFTTVALTPGTLAIALDPDNPQATSHPATTSLDYLKIRLTAANENIRIDSVKFTVGNSNGAGVEADFSVFDSLTLSDGINNWSVSWTNNAGGDVASFTTTSPALVVSPTTPLTLTLKGKSKTTAAGKEATFTIANADITATGSLSAGAIVPTGGPLTSNLAQFVQGSLTLSQAVVPSSSLIPYGLGESGVVFLSFNLTADVNEEIDVERIAIVQNRDASLVNDLFNLRLVENSTGTVISSASIDAGNASFGSSGNPLFTLPASATAKRYDVVGDISAGATAGRLVQLSLATAALEARGKSTGILLTTAGTAVSGSTYIIGNASLTAAVSSTSPVSTVFRPNQTTGSTLAKFDVMTGSTEDLGTVAIVLTYNGTAVVDPANAARCLTNLKLSDGTTNHALSYAAGPPATFSTAATLNLTRNTTSTFTLLGDVIQPTGVEIGGLNFQFAISTGGVTGYGVTAPFTAYASTGTATAAQHYIVGDLSIGNHSSIAMPSQSSAQFITGNSAALTFFTGKVSAVNEGSKLNELKLGFSGTSGHLTDIELKSGTDTWSNPSFSSGKYVFNTQTPTQWSLAAGASADFTVQAKISATAPSGATVKFSLAAADLTAVGVASGKTLVVSGDLTGNTITLQKGDLTLSLDPSTPTTSEILIGGGDKLEAWFRMTAGSVEDIRLRKVILTEEGSAVDGTDISNVQLFLDDDTTAFGGTTVKALSNHVYSFSDIQRWNGAAWDDVTIPAGQTKVLKVKATVPVTATAGKIIRFRIQEAGLEGQGLISAASLGSTNNIISSGSGVGSSQGLKAGLVSVASDVESSPHAAFNNFIEIGSTGVVLFRFKVTAGDGSKASLEDIQLTDLRLRLNGTVEYFSDFKLYDAADTLLKTINPTTNDLVFESIGNTLTAGTSQTFTVRANVKFTAATGSSVSLSLINAGDLTATGVTTGQSIASTGTANWYSFITQKSSLTVSAPSVQVGATTQVPGMKFKAFEFRVTAGNYEGFHSPSFTISKSGTLADANLYAALYDGTTMIVDYAVFSGSSRTLAAPASQTLATGQTKTYSVWAYPQLASSSGSTFSLGISADGAVSATGASSGSTVTSTGTVSGATHTIQRSGVILSLDPNNPAGAVKLRGDEFELLRFSITTDGKQLKPAILTKVELTNLSGAPSGAILNTDYAMVGIYDEGGILIASRTPTVGKLTWNSGAGGDWTLDTTGTSFIQLAGVGEIRTRWFSVRASIVASATAAGSLIQAEMQAAHILVQSDDLMETYSVQGSATGNTFTVKPASLTVTHLDEAVKRGWSGASSGNTSFLVGNAAPGVGAEEVSYVVAVFQIANDNEEVVDINKITFKNVGSARYGTDFDNLRLFRLNSTDLAGAQALTQDNGSLDTTPVGVYNLADSSFNYGNLATQGNPADVFTFTVDDDDTDVGDTDISLATNGIVHIALCASFPQTGSLGRTLKFRIETTGFDALGQSSQSREPLNNQITALASSDSVQSDITKTLQVLVSSNNPSSMTCQVPPLAAGDFHPYTLFKFKLKNSDANAASISYGEILYSGSLDLVHLDNGDIAAGSYPNTRIQLNIPGHPFAANVKRTTDPATSKPKLIWNLDDANPGVNGDEPFTIAANADVEISLIVFLKGSASNVQNMKFDVTESSWLGKQAAGAGSNEEFLYSTGSATSNKHTTGDVLKISYGGQVFTGQTLGVFLGNGSGTEGVLRVRILNTGIYAIALNNLEVKFNTADVEGATVAAATAAGDLYEQATLIEIDEESGEYTANNWQVNYSGGKWPFNLGGGLTVDPSDTVLLEFQVQRHELCFDPSVVGNPPPWWPDSWPDWTPAAVINPNLATNFAANTAEVWTANSYLDWPNDTAVVVLAPVGSHNFSVSVMDNKVDGTGSDSGITYNFQSDNNVLGTSFSLSTAEVSLGGQ